MFWLELLVVTILANVFWAGLFCLIKTRLAEKAFPYSKYVKLSRKERLVFNREKDRYRFGESRGEQMFSILSGIFLAAPFLFIKKLPSATVAAWRAFWCEVVS